MVAFFQMNSSASDQARDEAVQPILTSQGRHALAFHDTEMKLVEHQAIGATGEPSKQGESIMRMASLLKW